MNFRSIYNSEFTPTNWVCNNSFPRTKKKKMSHNNADKLLDYKYKNLTKICTTSKHLKRYR